MTIPLEMAVIVLVSVIQGLNELDFYNFSGGFSTHYVRSKQGEGEGKAKDLQAFAHRPYFSYLFLGFSIAAWAAASFAIGTLYGEHDT